MKQQYLRLFPVLLGGLAMAGCVSQSQLDSMQMKINQQEQQIQMLNNQLSGVQPAQADTWAQVQSLRQEMAGVRGQIDNFNNVTAPVGGLVGLAQRVGRHDQALRAIGTQFALDLNLDVPTEGTDPNAAANAVPGMVSGVPGTGIPGASTPPTMQTVQQPQEAAAPVKTDPNKDTATVLYDTGIKSFNARNYKQAFNSFRDFTEVYPKHRLVSNAWFWRGECNFQQGNHPAAALDYEEVISKYPSSGKAASAYLKQGMSFISLGKKDAARLRLDELIKKFPKSPEATRARQLLKEI